MAAAHRPSSRTAILDAAIALVREGRVVSLGSAASAAGLTKPGLMYHFPTKHALMGALVDQLVDGYEGELRSRLQRPEDSTVEDRLGAYLDWAFTAEIDRSDLVLFADPRLRDHLTARWVERLRSWLEVPAELPPARRAQLLAVRLIADGSWFADASGIFALSPEERPAVFAFARALLLADAP